MVIHNGKEGEFVERPDGRIVFRPLETIAHVSDPTLRVQIEVLELLGIPRNSNLCIVFLRTFGQGIRDILNTYEPETGKKPEGKDIIWCLGRNLDINPREEVKRLKNVA